MDSLIEHFINVLLLYIQYSVYRIKVENYAIYEGIKLTNNFEINDLLIISNSLNTLLTLENLTTKNKITQNIQNMLIQKKKKNIRFMWAPSHTDIAGNEKTDKYADQATKIHSNQIIKKPSINDIKISKQKKIIFN